jgi:hypothetical protein
MEPSFVRFLAWTGAIFIMWLSVMAIFGALKDKGSESKKALWIAFIICTPVLGPVVFWFFGQAAGSKDELDTKEALLKARFNATAGGKE